MKIAARKYIYSETEFAYVEHEFEMDSLPPIGYFIGTTEKAVGYIKVGHANFVDGEWKCQVMLEGHDCKEHGDTVLSALKPYVDGGWKASDIGQRRAK